MIRAKDGDRVKIHYTKKLESGRTLDTSKGGQPLEIKIGRNIIPLFETSARGMEVGERKTVTVPPEKAHGPWRKELRVDIKKSELPKNVAPNIGHQVNIRKPDGGQIKAVVVDLKRDAVTVDMNHPLAGEKIYFDIEVVEIT